MKTPAVRQSLWQELGGPRRALVVLLSALLVMILLRFCLAFMIKTASNQVLERMTRYTGHIDDVSLTLWRGAYQFHGVHIATRDGKVPVPLFTASSVDIGLQWPALSRRQLVATVVLVEPQINFVAGPAEDKSQSGKEQNWANVMQDLVPVKIDSLEIHRGQVHVVDPYRQLPWDIHLDDVEASVQGLRSRRGDPGQEAPLPCALSMTASLMDVSSLKLNLRFDAFADKATFDYSVILLKLPMQRMNPVMDEYLGTGVASGELSIYSEGKAESGKFQGYIKPMIKGLQVMRPRDVLSVSVVKKSLIGLLAWIFKNHSRDMDATVVPLSGDLSDPTAHLLPAFWTLVRNAFFSPVLPRLDHQTDLHEFQ